MKYTVVLPSRFKPYTDSCIETIKFPGDRLLIVDNTINNRGVSKSWNLGVERALADGSEWLVMLSAAIRFGKAGGLDFIAALAEHGDHTVAEAMPVFGWHLIAFSRECLERVGKFDENLPNYFNDIDYSLRIQKEYQIDGRQVQLWDKFEVDLEDMGMGHAAKMTKVYDPAEPRIEYFKAKWGRHPGDYKEDAFDHPFNDFNNDLKYWPVQ